MRAASRGAKFTLSAVAAILFAGGLLHTPWARPLLRRAGGCPVPRATAAQIEAAQARAWRSLRGGEAAAARPALGFALESTTLAEVRGWAREHGVFCEVLRDGALLLCGRVPESALSIAPDHGAYDELAFGFRARDGRLVNVTALRTGLGADEAAARVAGIAASLERALGAPSSRMAGNPALVLYRRSDYLAEVSALSLSGRGHALREHYMSALE
jgi:hypothetical protein